MISNDLTMRS